MKPISDSSLIPYPYLSFWICFPVINTINPAQGKCQDANSGLLNGEYPGNFDWYFLWKPSKKRQMWIMIFDVAEKIPLWRCKRWGCSTFLEKHARHTERDKIQHLQQTERPICLWHWNETLSKYVFFVCHGLLLL